MIASYLKGVYPALIERLLSDCVFWDYSTCHDGLVALLRGSRNRKVLSYISKVNLLGDAKIRLSCTFRDENSHGFKCCSYREVDLF